MTVMLPPPDEYPPGLSQSRHRIGEVLKDKADEDVIKRTVGIREAGDISLLKRDPI